MLLLFPAVMFAQNIKLEGIVKDSLNNPLEMASVIAFKKGTQYLQSYSVSGSKGNYKLDLEVGLEYTIRISYLGYDAVNVDISIPNDAGNQTRDFVLNQSSQALNEVEITYEMPVKIVGDTIVYNSDSFTTGTERKLEDVLEKLPGVEIDENGEVEVEGKKVSRVLVEGKEFFDGDSKLATQNIPASAVDKVQVLRNYNEVAGMRGVTNNEDNIALNIKLKKGKESFWFGEVNAGAGATEENTKYLAKPKLFYYSPNKSLNLLADFNNIGEAPFTRQDYFRFTGGLRGGNTGSGTNFNVSSNNLGFLTAQNNRAEEIISKFGALNFSFAPKKTWDLKGFAIVSDSETSMFTQTQTVYNSSNVTDFVNNKSLQESTQGLFKIGSTITPNNNWHIDYDLFGKISEQSEITDVESTQRGEVDTFKEEQPNSINQNLNVYYTPSEKNIFSAELKYLYQDDEPLYNSLANVQPFDLIPSEGDNGVDDFDMFQYRELTTSRFDAKLDYYHVLNKKNHLNFVFGTTLSSQDYTTSIAQRLDDGTFLKFPEPNLNNEAAFKFNDVYFGAKFRMVSGIFTFEPGISLHNYTTKDNQLGDEVTNSEWRWTPSIYGRLQFNSSKSLRFNYNLTNQYADITSMAEGYVLNNYQSMSRGNRLLENAFFHRYNLSYFSFSMFSFTNLNASLTYTKRVDGIKNNTEIIGIDRVSYPVNSALAEDTFSGFFRFGKTFSRWKMNLQANFSNSNFNNVVNDEIVKSKSFSHSYQGSVATKFKNAPNFEIGYQKSYADYAENGSQTDRPFGNLEIPFLKNFILTADYSYYNYRNDDNTIENTYSFLGAKLYFQTQDSPWEFILSGDNLTDNKSINTDSYNEISDSNRSSLYYIQPRLYMFTVRYNL